MVLSFCFAQLSAEYIPQLHSVPLKPIYNHNSEEKAWYVPTEEKADKVIGVSGTAVAAGLIGYKLFAEHADPHGRKSIIDSGFEFVASIVFGLYFAELTDNKKLSMGSALIGFLLGIGHAQRENNPSQST
jgi:hypothetical protein